MLRNNSHKVLRCWTANAHWKLAGDIPDAFKPFRLSRRHFDSLGQSQVFCEHWIQNGPGHPQTSLLSWKRHGLVAQLSSATALSTQELFQYRRSSCQCGLGDFRLGRAVDKIYTVDHWSSVPRWPWALSPSTANRWACKTPRAAAGSWDNLAGDRRHARFYGDAIGDGFFRGGWALVGECARILKPARPRFSTGAMRCPGLLITTLCQKPVDIPRLAFCAD